jgi:hypothetical protein
MRAGRRKRDPSGRASPVCVDVYDIQMDERVRPRVAFVFGQIEPNASARHRNKQWEAELELMLSLVTEAQRAVMIRSADGSCDHANHAAAAG